MPRLFFSRWNAVVLSCCLFFGRAAHAKVTLSASIGYGFEFSPRLETQAENLMLAPGISLLNDLLRFELGFVGAYGAVIAGDRDHVNLEIRPMLRLKIPVVPLYGRLTVAGVSLFEDRRNIAYGPALGVSFGLFGLSIFGEAGLLPRHHVQKTHWIGEVRAGAGYAF